MSLSREDYFKKRFFSQAAQGCVQHYLSMVILMQHVRAHQRRHGSHTSLRSEISYWWHVVYMSKSQG